MKKIIAILLAVLTLVTSIFSLSGCTKKESTKLEVGQWLGMINSAFGMESYTMDEPYISSVSKSDEYFNTVQVAAEWEVINKDDTFNPHDALLWKTALVTLVNAGEFLKSDASEKEKIDFATKNFDDEIRDYWMEREIDIEYASKLLVAAKNCWANKTYDMPVQNINYSDDVVDLSKDKNAILDNDINNGIITINSNELKKKIEKDDIFIVPKNDVNSETIAYRAEEVVENEGKTYIKTDNNLELGDFVDELYVEDTFAPDLTTAEIYDGNGNLVQAGVNATPQSYYENDDIQITNLALSKNNIAVTPVAQKTSFSFETDSCKVEVSIKKDGLSAKIEVPTNDTDKFYYETEVNNFVVTNKIDYSWFTLHSAEIKVDYSTKNTVGYKRTLKEKEGVYAPKWSNGNGKFLTNLKNSKWKNTSNKKLGAKTIKLGSIKVASVGVASFSVDVYAKFKVDGSVEVVCSETGCKGIEYKNGNCRLINTSDKDTDVAIKCKAEATVSVGPTVNAFGFAIIGLKAEAGFGAEASVKFHLADPGNHLLEEISCTDIIPEDCQENKVTGLSADTSEIQKLAELQGGKYEIETSTVNLHIDTCIDVNVYFILRVGIEEETLAGKLLKGTKIKVQWEICNSKNAKIANIHIENFDFITAFKNIAFFTDKDQCTLKYVPFDGTDNTEETTTNETTTNSSVAVGEVLTISTINVVLEPNKNAIISVTQIPKGYSLKDVVCKSKNPDIADIDKNGVISAKSEGSTTVVVSTSDGKYSCACTVTVVNEKTNEFTPLSYRTRNDIEVMAA